MSINFDDDMGMEAADLIHELFDVRAMDETTVLLERMANPIRQKDMKKIAKAARQSVTLEINKKGDRKEVGGVVYELDELGWKRLPYGTVL